MNHKGRVHPDTIKSILRYCQHNKTFSLTDDEYSAAMVYFPGDLMARHTNGDVFKYESVENFIDGINLTLSVYPVFISQINQLKEPPKKLIE